MRLFGDVFRGRRVLITGHTGFKGSWLALWLRNLDAVVTGVALSPIPSPNHWDLLALDMEDYRLDMRDSENLARTIREKRPEIVFHLAAQPLVRRSYREPLETWSTNVMGTANLLDACRRTESVRAAIIVTTDKCYQNREWPWGYRENDRLGGNDPYSASKAAAELVAASYRNAFFDEDTSVLVATARAGNVVGGGDWSEDRLIPDLVRAVNEQRPLVIRSPAATRPWQHVLESLSGYLLLGQKLLEGDRDFANAWNFGPNPEGNYTVAGVLDRLSGYWPEVRWKVGDQAQTNETKLLYLDSSKANSLLGWRAVWQLDDALIATADWYRAWFDEGQVISRDQLTNYVQAAHVSDMGWAAQ